MYKIVNAECLADKIYLMDVEAPRVARACQPGEFVIVKMDEVGERIPLTICDFDREKGLVTIVFQIVGASTMRMAELKAGDYFQDFVGPLGQPSEFVKEDLEEVKKRKYLFVAGGVGSAPVYPQVKWMSDDLHIWIFHSSDQCIGIFLSGSCFYTGNMKTGDHIVHFL